MCIIQDRIVVFDFSGLAPVSIIQALQYQYRVANAEVKRKGDDGGYKIGPDGTYEVEDIAEGPNEEEEDGNGVSRLADVVFVQLGELLQSQPCTPTHIQYQEVD